MIGIAARSKNNVIGKNGRLPWSCPEDLKFFKKITSHGNLVLGMETFKTLPFLPYRDIYILTRRPIEEVKIDPEIYPKTHPYFMKGKRALFINDIDDAPNDSFLCGGGQIYEKFLDSCSSFYLTTVDSEVGGDTYFPIKKFLEFFHRKEEVQRGDGYMIERYKR